MSLKEIQFVVEARHQLTESCFEVHLRPEPEFTFLPGQFASFVIPSLEAGGRDLRRAYSIASNPEKRPIEFCVKLVVGGPGSTYLSQLKPGDAVRGFAPYGHFVYKSKPERKVMMIATGTGIAPFRSMLYSDVYAANPPADCRLLLGIRDPGELLYPEEMQNKLGDRFQVCMSRVEKPAADIFKGRVTDWVRAQQLNFAEWDFYLCGNGAMIHELQKLLFEKGVQKSALFKEAYYQPAREPAPDTVQETVS